MSGTRLAYFLWVRWTSGVEDNFELSELGYYEWLNFLRNQTPSSIFKANIAKLLIDNSYVYLRGEEIVAHRLYTKKLSPNELNDPDHYDNPLN